MESGPKPGGITRDDWLQALTEADAPEPENEPGVFTIAELQQKLGMKRLATTTRVQRLIEQGKAVQTTKRIRRCDGAVISVTAYRLVQS